MEFDNQFVKNAMIGRLESVIKEDNQKVISKNIANSQMRKKNC